jgi:phage terminase Nu1 subunit (DNA packaging protein)
VPNQNGDNESAQLQTTHLPLFGILTCVTKEEKSQTRELQGWQEIADFLGLPVATAQRWQKSGMPVRRGGRYIYAVPAELNAWLSKESPSHSSVHIATEHEDLAADLKRALSEARRTRTKSTRKAA